MRGGKWVSFVSRPARGTKRSRATLTTSGLKQGRSGVGRPGPGRVWRQAEPAGRGRRTRPCSGKQDGRCGAQGGLEGAALPSSPRLQWGWGRMDSEKQRPAPGAGLGAASSCPPPPTPTRHSLLGHPGVLEGDEDQVQTVQSRAVELRVEFISQLLLQLAVVLFCVHLAGREAAVRTAAVRAPGRPPLSPRGAGRCAWGAGGVLVPSPAS